MRRIPTVLVVLGLLAGCEDFNEAMDPDAEAPSRQVGGGLAPVTEDVNELGRSEEQRARDEQAGSANADERDEEPANEDVPAPSDPPEDASDPNGESEPETDPLRPKLPDLPLPGRGGAAADPRGDAEPIAGSAVPVSVAKDEETEPLVRLSTGTALAQTLPTGTAMGFGVEYTFLGDPPADAQFAVVVRDGSGQTIAKPVVPNSRGRGSVEFFTPWKPDQKPFRAVFVMAVSSSRPRAVSNVVDLR